MQLDQIKRREFITLLGGGMVAWPLAARAQQPERTRRIVILLNAAADDPRYQPWVWAFLQALALLGWTIGRNVRIDHHAHRRRGGCVAARGARALARPDAASDSSLREIVEFRER